MWLINYSDFINKLKQRDVYLNTEQDSDLIAKAMAYGTYQTFLVSLYLQTTHSCDIAIKHYYGSNLADNIPDYYNTITHDRKLTNRLLFKNLNFNRINNNIRTFNKYYEKVDIQLTNNFMSKYETMKTLYLMYMGDNYSKIIINKTINRYLSYITTSIKNRAKLLPFICEKIYNHRDTIIDLYKIYKHYLNVLQININHDYYKYFAPIRWISYCNPINDYIRQYKVNNLTALNVFKYMTDQMPKFIDANIKFDKITDDDGYAEFIIGNSALKYSTLREDKSKIDSDDFIKYMDDNVLHFNFYGKNKQYKFQPMTHILLEKGVKSLIYKTKKTSVKVSNNEKEKPTTNQVNGDIAAIYYVYNPLINIWDIVSNDAKYSVIITNKAPTDCAILGNIVYKLVNGKFAAQINNLLKMLPQTTLDMLDNYTKNHKDEYIEFGSIISAKFMR